MAAPARTVSPDSATIALRLAAGGPVLGALLFGLGYWVNFSGRSLLWEPVPHMLMLAGYVLLGGSGVVGLLVLRAGALGGLAMFMATVAGLLGGVGMVVFRHWLPPLAMMGGCAYLLYRMAEARVRPPASHMRTDEPV
jgi:hypothetical protein